MVIAAATRRILSRWNHAVRTEERTSERVQFYARINRTFFVRLLICSDSIGLSFRLSRIVFISFKWLCLLLLTLLSAQNHSSLLYCMDFHTDAEMRFPLLDKAISQICVDICIRFTCAFKYVIWRKPKLNLDRIKSFFSLFIWCIKYY